MHGPHACLCSALTKLVTREVESAALQAYPAGRSEAPWVTVGLTPTELLRAAYRTGAPQTVDDARTVLATLDVMSKIPRRPF